LNAPDHGKGRAGYYIVYFSVKGPAVEDHLFTICKQGTGSLLGRFKGIGYKYDLLYRLVS